MATRSRSHGFARLRIEVLEQRRLLAADLEPMGNGRFIDTIEWNGNRTEVEAGSWIVGIDRLEGTRAQASSQASDLVLSTLTPNTPIQFDRLLLSQQAILIRTPTGMSIDAIHQELGDLPGLRYIEPNFIVRAAAIPNDSQFGQLWGMNNTGQSGGVVDADIDATNAWDITTGSASQAVAVIDTGVNYNHPDLVGNMWSNPGEIAGDNIDNDNNGFVDDIHGWDFFNDDNNPMDDHGHGTHCAGTIGAVGNNGLGVAGVNWDVSLVALKFLGANGSGTEADAADAIMYATQLKRAGVQINVTSNSWGGDEFSQTLFDAITINGKEGMLFIAAAGNSNSNNEVANFYPSNFPHDGLISVAATDRFDNKSSFSSYGVTRVDLGAPGTSILSTVLSGGYGNANGTSMATPHVAGTAVLAWSLKPEATAMEIRQALFDGVDPLPDLNGRTVTGGRLNVFNTLNLLIPTGPQIVAQTPVGGVSSSTSQATVIFRDPMNTSSFSLSDIVSFTGPSNVDLSASITGFTWLDSTHLQIAFTAQSTPGLYALTLAPSILDSQGRPLDQDGDRANGEPIEDRYVLTFAIGSPISYVSNPIAASVLDLSAGDAGVLTLLDDVDDASMVLDLGAHSFTFYGNTYDQLSVSSNGLISLGGANDAFLNHDLNVHSEAGIIAALWDDWQTDGTAQDAVLAKFDGSRLIIEWSEVTRFLNAPSSVSFQLELQLDTGSIPGKIQLHYLDVDTGESFTGGTSATVGILPPRLDPSAPLLASLNQTQPWIAAGDSLQFEAPTDIRVTSLISNGPNQWTVQYAIHNVDAAPFSLSALWSSDDSADGADTWLSQYLVTQPEDLTIGSHTLTLDLGSELAIPGAGLPWLKQEGNLLLMADFEDAILELDSDAYQEDNALAFAGVYHLNQQPLMVFGSNSDDSSVVSATGANLKLVLNGQTTLYPASNVSQIVMYGRGGNDVLSVNNLSKEAGLFGGAGADTLTGGRLNDLLHGGAGDDDMIGGTGNDLYLFVTGNDGSDWLSDASGVDTLDFAGQTVGVTIHLGQAGVQNVHGTLQIELASNIAFENVIGGSGNDSLSGNGRANLLQGNGGDDLLQGDLGNDVYRFQADSNLGNDVLNDLGGLDTLDFSLTLSDLQLDLGSTVSQAVNANLGLQLSSGSSIENASGGSGNDLLIGNVLANVLNGGAGNDALRGGKGNDTYRFGVAVMASEVDTVEELAAGGTDLLDFSELPVGRPVSIDLGQMQIGVEGTRTIQVAASGQNLQLENLLGGAGNDLLIGNNLANTITGGAGSDVLRGSSGNDIYVFASAVGAEQDIIDESTNGGTDTLSFATLPASVGVTIDLSSLTTDIGSHVGRTLAVLSAGNANNIENLIGGSGPDTLQGGNSANSLTGNLGNDILRGGNGDDTYLFARKTGVAEVDVVSESPSGGVDTLSFATLIASDSVTVDLTQDTNLASHLGRVIQTANSGEALNFENVLGGLGNDTLSGNASNNSLLGGAGNDYLDGREGDDLLEGGAGDDQLAGGQGSDTYRFKAASGSEVDTLMEGLTTGGDWLDFSALNSATPVSVFLNATNQTLATHVGRSVQTSNAGDAQYWENVLGGAGNDILHGNDADNVLMGMRGNDWIDGNAGFDTLDGGLGTDTGLDGEVLINFP